MLQAQKNTAWFHLLCIQRVFISQKVYMLHVHNIPETIIMGQLDQNVILSLVILQSWRHCDPQWHYIRYAVKVTNATHLCLTWCHRHLVHVPPIWDDSVRWWVLLWRAVDILLCVFFKMSQSLHDAGFCKVMPRNCASNTTHLCLQIQQAWIVTDPAWDDNRKDQKESIDSDSHMPYHHKTSTQQDLSCIEFHMGV